MIERRISIFSPCILFLVLVNGCCGQKQQISTTRPSEGFYAPPTVLTVSGVKLGKGVLKNLNLQMWIVADNKFMFEVRAPYYLTNQEQKNYKNFVSKQAKENINYIFEESGDEPKWRKLENFEFYGVSKLTEDEELLIGYCYWNGRTSLASFWLPKQVPNNVEANSWRNSLFKAFAQIVSRSTPPRK